LDESALGTQLWIDAMGRRLYTGGFILTGKNPSERTMGNKLCPQVILEGPRLTFKSERAFELNRHTRHRHAGGRLSHHGAGLEETGSERHDTDIPAEQLGSRYWLRAYVGRQ
jgi:hypothetical protein